MCEARRVAVKNMRQELERVLPMLRHSVEVLTKQPTGTVVVVVLQGDCSTKSAFLVEPGRRVYRHVVQASSTYGLPYASLD